MDASQLLTINLSLLYSKGNYGVVITGPQDTVTVGDLVELNCMVRPNVQLPSSFTVTRNLSLLFTSRSVEDIILPNGELGQGIQMLKHRVKLTDGGWYTCEAHWNVSNTKEKDRYKLHIKGDFLDAFCMYSSISI